MADEKNKQQTTGKRPLNEEGSQKSYTTSHLDDKLSAAGKAGTGGKTSSGNKQESDS